MASMPELAHTEEIVLDPGLPAREADDLEEGTVAAASPVTITA
jgi:hypothetical protein